MYIKLKKQKIQKSFSKIQNIIEKSNIPVLNYFFIDVTENGVFILATDLDSTVKLPIEAEVFKIGKACIPARKFYEILKVLDEDIEISLLKQRVIIRSEKLHFILCTIPPSEFPIWLRIGDTIKINLSSDLLLTAMEKTLYAVGEADARYVWNTLLFHLKPGELHVVGTDIFRLAHFKVKIKKIKKETKLLLSKKSLNELKKFLSDTETVSIKIGKTHVIFEIGRTCFLSRIIEGNYPKNYEAFIPLNNKNQAIVDRDLFIASLKKVSVFYKDKINARIITEWQSNSVIISCAESNLVEARDELPVNYQGEPITIGFNAKYLIDALEKITSEKAKITMSEPEKPVYITDVGVNSFVYECVVMPLKL